MIKKKENCPIVQLTIDHTPAIELVIVPLLEDGHRCTKNIALTIKDNTAHVAHYATPTPREVADIGITMHIPLPHLTVQTAPLAILIEDIAGTILEALSDVAIRTNTKPSVACVCQNVHHNFNVIIQ